MKQKSFLTLAILGMLLVSGCIGEKTENTITVESGGPLVKNAVPIYKTNQTIDSDSKAQQIFNEHFNGIIDATKQTLSSKNACDMEDTQSNLKVCYAMSEFFSGIKSSCIENNEILSNNITFERRVYQKDDKRFGSFWRGDFNKEQYTFKIYFKGNDYNLKYIMDSNGTVYLAGEYCSTN